jgi:hypothetical protein
VDWSGTVLGVLGDQFNANGEGGRMPLARASIDRALSAVVVREHCITVVLISARTSLRHYD